MANENGQIGKIVQIIGPVVDVEFEGNYLPPIYQALTIVLRKVLMLKRRLKLSPKFSSIWAKVAFVRFRCCRPTEWFAE